MSGQGNVRDMTIHNGHYDAIEIAEIRQVSICKIFNKAETRRFNPAHGNENSKRIQKYAIMVNIAA